MQNIGFSNSGYVIKPPQPSSAVYGAPPFTGHPMSDMNTVQKIQKTIFNENLMLQWQTKKMAKKMD